MSMKDPYIESLAEAAIRLAEEKGVTDPHADEITTERFHGDTNLGNDIYQGVRVRMTKVLRAVQDLGYTVYPLSAQYYAKPLKVPGEPQRPSFRDQPPETTEDLKRCLPIGNGKRAVGMRFCTKGANGQKGEPDKLYRVWLDFLAGSGAAKARINIDRAFEARENGFIETDDTVLLIENVIAKAQPVNQTAIAEMIAHARQTPPTPLPNGALPTPEPEEAP
jgi:hypothetical protein